MIVIREDQTFSLKILLDYSFQEGLYIKTNKESKILVCFSINSLFRLEEELIEKGVLFKWIDDKAIVFKEISDLEEIKEYTSIETFTKFRYCSDRFKL